MDVAGLYTVRWDDLPDGTRAQIVDAAVEYCFQLFGNRNHASYSFNRWWLDHYCARRYYRHPYWLIEFPNQDSYTRFVLTWL